MPASDELVVRRARTSDVRGIRRLVDTYTDGRRLLSKATVTLYEDVQEFRVVADGDGAVVGCGALHVMWRTWPRSARSPWTRRTGAGGSATGSSAS